MSPHTPSSAAIAALSLSPPLPDSLARRRSQSSSGSYRTSLGGKPIGPKYHGVSSRKSSAMETGAIGGHSGAVIIQDNSSRISSSSSSAHNDSDIANGDGAHHIELGGGHNSLYSRIGAFSHTRDEIRDSQSPSWPKGNKAYLSILG